MNEATILKVAIIATIVGLLTLFFYMEEVDIRNVARIDSIVPEETVQVKGTVTRANAHDNVLFLEVEGTKVEPIDVILFTSDSIYVKEGDTVEITGTVEEYEGKKEIIANSITKKWLCRFFPQQRNVQDASVMHPRKSWAKKFGEMLPEMF